MNSLGLYFGPHIISIVEAKNKEPVRNIQIPRTVLIGGETIDEKVPEQLKILTVLKDEFRKNNIAARDVSIGLSGKDLIIRTFDMPVLPHQELATAINFEVKKYIPFKTEELISDFQCQLDKSIQKLRILFIGIKRDALDRYLQVFKELGLEVNSVEYSAFSILRLLHLSGIKEKGIIAVVTIDATKDDDTNFVVLENGFPLFSRDITLVGGYEEPEKKQEEQASTIVSKLKREMQISLDYYDRKFPGKSIAKIIFISNPDYHGDFEDLIKESGIAYQFVDLSKGIGKAVPFSLAFVKAYSSAICKVDTGLKLNLLAAKDRAMKKASAQEAAAYPLFALLKANAAVLAASLLICLAVFLFGIYRLLPLRKELTNIIGARPQVSSVIPELPYDELAEMSSAYEKKIADMDGVIKSRTYTTAIMDALPRDVIDGIWLTDLSFRREEGDKLELTLKGIAYLNDNVKEASLVDNFIVNLKQDATLAKYFKEINLMERQKVELRGAGITSFSVSLKGRKT